jgi:hypothetical protein
MLAVKEPASPITDMVIADVFITDVVITDVVITDVVITDVVADIASPITGFSEHLPTSESSGVC